MTSAFFDRPTLAGRRVRLEPLTLDHAEDLFDAAKDPDVFTWLNFRQPKDVAETRAYVSRMLAMYEDRQVVPWAQIDVTTDRPAGVTSFHEISVDHRTVCIGHTWLGKPWHRTGMNPEAKLLLMERAFQTLGARRVAWMTHHGNLRSQRAIERLGATREGVLRQHRIMPDGSNRDSVIYSIIDSEWPSAAEALRSRLH
jgi:RimJ/RimL family protein N-acetyltransferase